MVGGGVSQAFGLGDTEVASLLHPPSHPPLRELPPSMLCPPHWHAVIVSRRWCCQMGCWSCQQLGNREVAGWGWMGEVLVQEPLGLL